MSTGIDIHFEVFHNNSQEEFEMPDDFEESENMTSPESIGAEAEGKEQVNNVIGFERFQKKMAEKTVSTLPSSRLDVTPISLQEYKDKKLSGKGLLGEEDLEEIMTSQEDDWMTGSYIEDELLVREIILINESRRTAAKHISDGKAMQAENLMKMIAGQAVKFAAFFRNKALRDEIETNLLVLFGEKSKDILKEVDQQVKGLRLVVQEEK